MQPGNKTGRGTCKQEYGNAVWKIAAQRRLRENRF